MSMSQDRLHLMETFIRIVETGSLSAAARHVRVAQSSVSRQLRQLEDSLGVSLISRTTHRLALTDAGRLFLADCRRLVHEWNAIEERLRHGAAQPSGRIRVVASIALGQLVLAEIAARYCRKYPGVEVEWNVDDGPVSILQSGIDCLIKVGPITERSVFTRVLGGVAGALVAAPVIIDERGLPRRPIDLHDWPMISVQPYFADSIPIRSRTGSAKAKGIPRFLTHNMLAARGAARAGAGFTLLPEWLAEPDIQAGTLVRLLPGWEPRAQPLSVGTPPTTYRQVSLKLFVDEIAAGIREHLPLVKR
jgi:DNA-binding transcriptional LysR family regulator